MTKELFKTNAMNKLFITLGCLLMAVMLYAQERSATYLQDFNAGWKFHLGDLHNAQVPAFADADWRELNLPHDWSIEGDFSASNPATPGGGALPGGIGWYRKTFTVSNQHKGKQVYIDFDGIYWNSSVWINGHFLGNRPNGYISFRYDLTSYIQFGGENVIAVKVDNSRQPNSRWYSGSGIYRKVQLHFLNPVHVAYSGTYITTPQLSLPFAQVQIETTLENKLAEKGRIIIETTIADKQGKVLALKRDSVTLNAPGPNVFNQKIPVTEWALWDINNPVLYTATTTIRKGKTILDVYHTGFGFRDFYFDAEEGFFLNGKNLKILGVCNHHDLGCLGTAVNRVALRRQLQIMKDMGVNALRTAHNPQARELLELCDEMGLLVMDEMFDMWRKKKSPFDYAQYFPEWHQRDLADFIKRDRNHPSVIMWSVGNEVLEQWSHIDADTLNLQEANMILNFANTLNRKSADTSLHINSLLAIKLADLARHLDPTRPVITGNNETEPYNHIFRANTMDIIGFNYHENNWPDFHKQFPGQKLLITESTSGLMSRGFYLLPSDSAFIWPKSWDQPFDRAVHHCSSYDHNHVPWGTTHEDSWKLVKKFPHISGMFIWTGFDYLGEPTPFWWPSRSSYFGIVDLAGFPKDVYYMYQSEWTDKKLLHIFPHWNWNPGDTVDVWAYYNQADEAELYLNGRSLGKRSKNGDDLHVVWRTIFEPGSLSVVSRKNGVAVLEKEIHTAGQPANIRLTPDRSRLNANAQDLSFVTVELIDARGNPVPVADQLMHFSIEGPAIIAGTDNGDPTDTLSLKKPMRKLFNGKALVVVQETGNGEIILKAFAEGMEQAIRILSE